MEKSRILSLATAVFGIFTLLPIAQAGSERLVMVMSAQKMAQHQLVHVRFQNSAGNDLNSTVMKRLVIRSGDCNSGVKYTMPDDYKFGYSPRKEMGIYLPPQRWRNKKLCFTDPEHGQLATTISDKEAGLSIVRAFK